MLNTILAVVSMSLSHVETWMIRDLHIAKSQIDRVFLNAQLAGVAQQNDRLQQRVQKALRETDLILARAAADREAKARKAAADQEAEAKRKQNQVD